MDTVLLQAKYQDTVYTALTIRQATPKDADLLTALGVATFTESYARHNAPENMAQYLSVHFNIGQLEKEISDPLNIFFLVLAGGQPAGYVKLCMSTPPDELKHSKTIEIERIYVLNQYQGQKAGAGLMQHCIQYAGINGYDILWLGVWEHNTKALTFYNRWGFEAFGDHPFLLGNDVQTDLLLKKSLSR